MNQIVELVLEICDKHGLDIYNPAHLERCGKAIASHTSYYRLIIIIIVIITILLIISMVIILFYIS